MRTVLACIDCLEKWMEKQFECVQQNFDKIRAMLSKKKSRKVSTVYLCKLGNCFTQILLLQFCVTCTSSMKELVLVGGKILGLKKRKKTRSQGMPVCAIIASFISK